MTDTPRIRKDPTADTPALKAARRKRREDAKAARAPKAPKAPTPPKRKGRPVGSRNAVPKAKRVLTPVQKLREHVLIELGVDKKDIAQALGVTRQAVSGVFVDTHRSAKTERGVVEYLRARYGALDDHEREGTNRQFHPSASAFNRCPVTLETMGWAEKADTPGGTPDAEPDTRGESGYQDQQFL